MVLFLHVGYELNFYFYIFFKVGKICDEANKVFKAKKEPKDKEARAEQLQKEYVYELIVFCFSLQLYLNSGPNISGLMWLHTIDDI